MNKYSSQCQLSTFLNPAIQFKDYQQQHKKENKQAHLWQRRFYFFYFFLSIVLIMIAFYFPSVRKQFQSKSDNEDKQKKIKKSQLNTSQKIPHPDLIHQNKSNIVTNLDQLYNFTQQGQIFEGFYSSKDQQSLLNNFENATIQDSVTLVVTTSNDSNYLRGTLRSFFRFNTYPITNILVIKDGPINQQIQKLKRVYTNITWLITNKKIGQLAAIDIAYSFIKTKYYFHLEDDWAFMKSGFIQFSLNIYSTLPNVSNVWLFKLASLSPKKQPQWKIVDYRENVFSGYNFNPSIHLTKDYKLWPGGFSNLTFFATFGLGAGLAQLVISMHYIMIGKYTVLANEDYIRHIGRTKQGGQKFNLQNVRESEGAKKLRQVIENYSDWVNLQNEIKDTQNTYIHTSKATTSYDSQNRS